MHNAEERATSRRKWWPWIVAVIGAGLYVASSFFYSKNLPTDQSVATAVPSANGLGVFLIMKDIQLNTDRITVDLTFAFGEELVECNPVCGLNKDVILLTSPSNQSKIQLPRGTPIGYSTPINLYLQGAPYTYPFDTYASRVYMEAISTSSDGTSQAIPIVSDQLVPEGFVGWDVELGYPAADSTPDATTFLTGDIDGLDAVRLPSVMNGGQTWALMQMERSFSTKIISILVLALMVVLASLSIIASHDVQVGKRENTFGMAAWLTGLLFAMPALRALLPGAPPLGSWIDILVFFWVEIATMMSLATYVLFWVRQAPMRSDARETDERLSSKPTEPSQG